MAKCRKKRYRTEWDAKVALAGMTARALFGSTDRREKRYYVCPKGQHYHLTSQTPRAVRGSVPRAL